MKKFCFDKEMRRQTAENKLQDFNIVNGWHTNLPLFRDRFRYYPDKLVRMQLDWAIRSYDGHDNSSNQIIQEAFWQLDHDIIEYLREENICDDEIIGPDDLAGPWLNKLYPTLKRAWKKLYIKDSVTHLIKLKNEDDITFA
jgi:hypothetical protein